MKGFLTVFFVLLLSSLAFSQATPVRSVSILPLTCSPGGGPGGPPADHIDLFVGGTNTPYYCASLNTWATLSVPNPVTAAANYTVGSMHSAGSFQTNGCTPALVYGIPSGPSGWQNDSVNGCNTVPSTAPSTFQATGVTGYIFNNSINIQDAIAVEGISVNNAIGTSNHAASFVDTDMPGVPNSNYGFESFSIVQNAASAPVGGLFQSDFIVQPTIGAAIQVASNTVANTVWPWGLRFETNSTPEANSNGAAILFNPVNASANSNSQGPLYVSNDSSTVGGVDTFIEKLTSGGNVDFLTSKPGAAMVANIFQAFDFISQNAGTPASTGVFRGVSADWMAFRNVANAGDVILSHDATDGFTANGPGGLSAVGFNATGAGSGSYYCASGGTPQGILGELLIACPPTVIGTLVTQGIQYAGQGVLGAYSYQNSVVTPSGTVTSTNMQNFYSGDANHSATVVIGSGTSIGATILCSLLNCPGGTYEVNAYLDITTPCGTTGTYIPWVGYADDSGVRAGSSTTTFIPIQGTGSAPATGTLTTTNGANYGQGDFRLHSTVTKGVLNSNGTALTWVSGSQFNSSGAWNNTFIVLGNPGPGGGGQEFQIASCASATACTLAATSGPANSGIPYTQGNDISYGTTATSCGTAGPMVGKMYLSTVPVQ